MNLYLLERRELKTVYIKRNKLKILYLKSNTLKDPCRALNCSTQEGWIMKASHFGVDTSLCIKTPEGILSPNSHYSVK